MTFFLNRIISVPVYDEPGCLSCCPGDYYQRLEATHSELTKLMQQENDRVRGRGVRWEWAGGVLESVTPMLVLESNGLKDPIRYKNFVSHKFILDNDTNLSFEMARMYLFNKMSLYDRTLNINLFTHLYTNAPPPINPNDPSVLHC